MLDQKNKVTCFTYDAKSEILFSGDDEGTLTLWNKKNQFEKLDQKKLHSSPMNGILVKNQFLISSHPRSLVLFNIEYKSISNIFSVEYSCKPLFVTDALDVLYCLDESKQLLCKMSLQQGAGRKRESAAETKPSVEEPVNRRWMPGKYSKSRSLFT